MFYRAPNIYTSITLVINKSTDCNMTKQNEFVIKINKLKKKTIKKKKQFLFQMENIFDYIVSELRNLYNVTLHEMVD